MGDPVIHLLPEFVRLRPTVLPRGVVGELQVEGGKVGCAALGVGSIERRQVLQENGRRPCVEREVMKRDEEHVFARAEANEPGSHELPARQIEGLPRVGPKGLGERFRRAWSRPLRDVEIEAIPGESRALRDPELGPVVGRDDRRSQHLVALDEAAERAA